ncbi:hypothetical protein L6R52_31260 [Myxococcota bacterium]|nr:hypothetical protein [Myxococcota bacterium]
MRARGLVGWVIAAGLAAACDVEPPFTPTRDADAGADAGAVAGAADSGVLAVSPEFSLVDLNPTSVTHGRAVSPRDYLERVSGWYFTHAS